VPVNLLDRVAELALIRPALPCRYEVVLKGISPLLVVGGSFPFNDMQSLTQKQGNSVIYLPETYDVTDVTLDIVETDASEVMNFFEEWRSEVFCGIDGQSDLYNLSTKYKREFRVFRLNGEGSRTAGFRYEGAWPKSISPFAADSSANTEALKFTVTLSVDSVFVERV